MVKQGSDVPGCADPGGDLAHIDAWNEAGHRADRPRHATTTMLLRLPGIGPNASALYWNDGQQDR